MSKMVQIRNLPDDVHRTLKSRAAGEGMTLSDYLKRELEFFAQRPTWREWLKSTAQLKPIRTKKSGAQLIRELRESR